jgi:hypothetical protein
MVPLIKQSNNTLYETLLLQRINNTVSYIWPESPFIAIDKESNTYILISENQLKECKITRITLICARIGLQKLHTHNTWIYSTVKEEDILVGFA